VHVDAVDAKGNMASFTPSGAWIKSAEVIGALGFPLSMRMMTFYLRAGESIPTSSRRASARAPPSRLHSRSGRGKPWMTFARWRRPAGAVVAAVHPVREAFGMTIQEAIEAPKLSSTTFRASSRRTTRAEARAHQARFGAKAIDGCAGAATPSRWRPTGPRALFPPAQLDEKSGLLEAGCDPRGSKSECFPAFAYVW